jgi:hypothetical protein
MMQKLTSGSHLATPGEGRVDVEDLILDPPAEFGPLLGGISGGLI